MASAPLSSARIAVDAMGGDLGPAEVIEAVKLVLQRRGPIDPLILVGDKAVLQPLVHKADLDGHPGITVHHASEVITMEDKPLLAIKRKKDSSMVRAIELVRQGDASALVSCGNTGSLMAGGTIWLRTLDGVERPALGSVWPHKSGHFVLVDAGANPVATPEHLLHNAILGSNFCRVALDLPSPRVGLLTIGTEEGKGNELTKDAHELLKKVNGIINYAGPIEGYQVFNNRVDVVVCDGFVGNVLLKTCQSLFHLLKDLLKDELLKNPVRQAGAFLAQGAFKAIKNQINPDRYAGAPLLGLRGNILKAHGSSNRFAIYNAIVAAGEVVRKEMNSRIESEIAIANERVRQPV